MDSIFGWVGGKKLLRKTICERFPEEIGKFVEVFGGAAWVMFYKDKHADFETYNDINGQLVNLFRCVKYHSDAVISEMEYLLNSRETFNCFKNQSIEGLTDIQKAVRYLYLINTSYGSKMKTYGAKQRLIVRLDGIKDIQNRLRNVVIENKSFDAIIKHYDSAKTLFYCDPPYFEVEKFYDTGDFIFDEAQHVLLKEMLEGIKGKFVLSYNDCDFIRELYSDFSVEEVCRFSNLESRYGSSPDE